MGTLGNRLMLYLRIFDQPPAQQYPLTLDALGKPAHGQKFAAAALSREALTSTSFGSVDRVPHLRARWKPAVTSQHGHDALAPKSAALRSATAWVGPSAREPAPGGCTDDDPNAKDAASKAVEGDPPPATEAPRDHTDAPTVDVDARLAEGNAPGMTQPNGQRATSTAPRFSQSWCVHRKHPRCCWSSAIAPRTARGAPVSS